MCEGLNKGCAKCERAWRRGRGTDSKWDGSKIWVSGDDSTRRTREVMNPVCFLEQPWEDFRRQAVDFSLSLPHFCSCSHTRCWTEKMAQSLSSRFILAHHHLWLCALCHGFRFPRYYLACVMGMRTVPTSWDGSETDRKLVDWFIYVTRIYWVPVVWQALYPALGRKEMDCPVFMEPTAKRESIK